MLIEIRLMPGKFKLKEMINKIRQGSGLKKKRIIPHMSIYGPNVRLSNYSDVETVLARVGRKYDRLPFIITEYGHNKSENGNVVSLDITPSRSLINFRKEICQELNSVAPSQENWDNTKDSFWFHITISLKLSDSRFGEIWNKIHETNFQDLKGYKIPKPYLPMDGIRIACLNDKKKIQFEYDLLQKRILTRAEALSRIEWNKTLRLFRKQIGVESHYHQKKDSLSGIFLMSDLHLDHQNIIKYCARPFSNVREMNEVLLNNWNNVVSKNDRVYYLGDMSFGQGSNSIDYWCNKLNGKIEYIRGNHEKYTNSTKNYDILLYRGYQFLLVHDPIKLPKKWNGWVIHGHKHNNDVYNYPFINGESKTINISAELINYTPLDIDCLFRLKFEKIRRMDTLISSPIYF